MPCQLANSVLLKPVTQSLIAADPKDSSGLGLIAVRLGHGALKVVARDVSNDVR